MSEPAPLSYTRIAFLTLLTMIAFAGNSLLCRAALQETEIDAASFTAIRMASGAIMLWLIVQVPRRSEQGQGNWISAAALFVYAACLSFAYMNLATGLGALILFGAVQVTMIGHGLWRGERLRAMQLAGLVVALGGLVGLLLPGLSAPPLINALLMLASGIAWGVYSLRGKGGGDPTRVTAGNFMRTLPFVAVMLLLMQGSVNLDDMGVLYAIASGAVASGIGYALWYSVLPALRSTHAATIQLSVPVIAALGGIALLGESLTLRLVITSVAILGGIFLVIWEKDRRDPGSVG